MQTLNIPLNKKRLLGLLALFALILSIAIAVCLWLWQDGRIPLTLIVVTVGGIGVLVYVSIFTIRKVMSNEPALVLDASGVRDNINLSAAGTIPWTNISGAAYISHQHSVFMLLRLKNPESVLSRLSGMKLRMAQNNVKQFKTPSAINVSSLDFDANELMKIVQAEIAKWNA